ncbi:hypothetical protein C8Q74DRAFT_1221464 [Fomes fomentarius]|nr:hypothetical protein C8Q74DRAFT_1221464 [Fomes fomentarius]
MHSGPHVCAISRRGKLRSRQLDAIQAAGGYSQDAVASVYLSPDGQIVASDEKNPSQQDPPGQQGDSSATGGFSPPSDEIKMTPETYPPTVVISSEAPTGGGTALTTTQMSASPVTSLASTDISSLSVTSGTTSDLDAVSSPTPSSMVSSTSTSTSAPPSSSSNTSPTSKLDSASGGFSGEHTSLYVAIALGGFVAVGIIILLLSWWIRTRLRNRRLREEQAAEWPWAAYSPNPPQDSTLEGGLGIHGQGLQCWDSSRMLKEPFGDIEKDDPLHENDAYPVPPAPALMRARTRNNDPFVTIPLHDVGEQSVPGLAQESVGTLQITNLMPGDISGGEMSRASTAPDLAHTYSDNYGTPFQPTRPCFKGLDGDGLATPWAPLRPRKTKVGTRIREQEQNEAADISPTLDLPLPYPGDSLLAAAQPRKQETSTRHSEESWAASIRSNLYNAFSAVVGGSTSSLPAAVTASTQDGFTRPPERRSTPRTRKVRGPRANSASSIGSGTDWTLEETCEGRGVVHFGSDDDHRARDPFTDDVFSPPETRTYGEAHLAADPDPFRDYTDDSFHPGSGSTETRRPSRVGLHPPRLPSIPDFSDEGAKSLVKRDTHQTPYRKRTKRQRRPTLATRKSSSQASATSVGSEMSRTSSASSGQLTDGERFAQRILKERRRRIMEMTVGRTKTSRSRATTLMMRRSEGRNRKGSLREDA